MTSLPKYGCRVGPRVLKALRGAALPVTDESIAAAVRESGGECSQQLVSLIRHGQRSMSADMLVTIAEHCDAPEVVLDALARPFGLRVVRVDTPAATGATVAEEVLDVVDATGRLAATIRSATADRQLTPDELAEIGVRVAELQRQVAELVGALPQPSGLRAV